MSAAFASEAELARPVVQWLRDLGWEVFQEVSMGQSYPTADIVARSGKRLWVIECKRTFGMAVLDQAYYWLKHAQWVSVAVPRSRTRKGVYAGIAARHVLDSWGVGKLEVDPRASRWQVEPVRKPRGQKVIPHFYKELNARLVPEAADYCEAGTAGGGAWSPFKDTCEQVRRFAARNPGCTLKAAVEGVSHHYSSASGARSSLAFWIRQGKVPGVRAERNGRKLALFAEDEGAAT